MTHPRHPASAQYAELVAAGRAGSVENRTGTSTDELRDTTRCTLARSDGRPCDTQGVAILRRVDARGVVQAVCRQHALEYAQLPDTFVVIWVTQCSACGERARYVQLDSSGRCDECQP